MTLPHGPRDGVTRREVLQAAGAAALAAAGARRARAAAGVGHDRRRRRRLRGLDGLAPAAAGQRVLLLDASGPANARASSGGESRMTRTIYGADDVYTRMAWDSLEDWRWLSSRSGLPILHPIGVLMFFGKREPFVDQSIEAHRRLGLRLDVLDRAGAAAALSAGRRGTASRWACSSRTSGALMARRAVQTLVQEFVAAGGEYRLAAVLPPGDGAALDGVRTSAGETLRAERYVFACGPWLPKLFPSLLGARIFPTRQEVFFFAPENGDERFEPGAPARLGRLQRRRHLLRLPRPREPRLQDRPRRARRALRPRHRRPPAERGRARATSAPTWRGGSRRWPRARWWSPASASTRTARTATC